MSARHSAQRGVSLIELVITMAIIVILVLIGIPAYMEWIANTHIRSTAESYLNGVNLARNDAVKRNSSMSFSLVSDMTSSCALQTSGVAHWAVSMFPVTNLCNKTPDTKTSVTDTGFDSTTNPLILQTWSNDSARTKVLTLTKTCNNTAAAFGGVVTFTGSGRLAAPVGNQGYGCLPAAGLNYTKYVGIEIQSNSDLTCQHMGGTLRCLRVEIFQGGQVKLCDPAVTASSDSRICAIPGELK